MVAEALNLAAAHLDREFGWLASEGLRYQFGATGRDQ